MVAGPQRSRVLNGTKRSTSAHWKALLTNFFQAGREVPFGNEARPPNLP